MRRYFWTTSELRALGKSERDIRRALQRRVIRAVRRGWFASADAPEPLVRAMRVGGVLTGTAASQHLGLWTPPDPRLRRAAQGLELTPTDRRLQVAVPENTPRLHDPDASDLLLGGREDVLIHRTPLPCIRDARGTGVAGPLLMLQHVFKTQDVDRALAVVDSAIKQRYLRTADLAALAAMLPVHQRPAALAATGRADSGIESIARYRFELLALEVEVLQSLSRIGTVDLLIEGWLIVELDGREFHEKEQFERDRRRDLESARERYRTLRFSWRLVMFEWPAVEAAVLAALANRCRACRPPQRVQAENGVPGLQPPRRPTRATRRRG